MRIKDFIVVKLNKDLDESLQTVLPREFRGKRKSELRVNHVVRQFIRSHDPNEPARKTG